MRRDGSDLYAHFEVLRAGEVMLFSKGASVKVTNDGKILLHGDVYVQGDLYVNGQKMEVP